MKCCNCNGDKTVSVSIPCPDCSGNHINEIDVLRDLALWVDRNFQSIARPPSDGLELLHRVKLSQGKRPIHRRCEHCGEELHPNREVWLELDQRTNKYVDPNKVNVPTKYSQGGFPFGKACARKVLK